MNNAMRTPFQTASLKNSANRCLVLSLLVMPLLAFADTETVDGIVWHYAVRDGHAIVGEGDRAIAQLVRGNVVVPSELGGFPVTGIADSAFAFCNLDSLSIPEGVETIGNNAFQECGNLVSVDIPQSASFIGRYAFYGCSSLKTVSLPDE